MGANVLKAGSQPNLHEIENSHNLSAIHQNAFKFGHNIKHEDVNSLMALSVDKMGHVTCYECFIGLSSN